MTKETPAEYESMRRANQICQELNTDQRHKIAELEEKMEGMMPKWSIPRLDHHTMNNLGNWGLAFALGTLLIGGFIVVCKFVYWVTFQ